MDSLEGPAAGVLVGTAVGDAEPSSLSASSELTAMSLPTSVSGASGMLVSTGVSEVGGGRPPLPVVHSATTTANVSTSARVLRMEMGIRVTGMLTLRVNARRNDKWALA